MDGKKIKKILDILYPELNIEVSSIEILPRFKLNESQEWIEDTDSYFVGVKFKDYPSQASSISEIVSLYTGYEFNIYKV